MLALALTPDTTGQSCGLLLPPLRGVCPSPLNHFPPTHVCGPPHPTCWHRRFRYTDRASCFISDTSRCCRGLLPCPAPASFCFSCQSIHLFACLLHSLMRSVVQWHVIYTESVFNFSIKRSIQKHAAWFHFVKWRTPFPPPAHRVGFELFIMVFRPF